MRESKKLVLVSFKKSFAKPIMSAFVASEAFQGELP